MTVARLHNNEAKQVLMCVAATVSRTAGDCKVRSQHRAWQANATEYPSTGGWTLRERPTIGNAITKSSFVGQSHERSLLWGAVLKWLHSC